MHFGNRRVYCNGSIFIGLWNCVPIATFLMILVPTNLFLFIELVSPTAYGPKIFFLGPIFLLEVCSAVLFIKIAVSDPGIVLKPLDDPETPQNILSQPKQIVYENRLFVLKYCKTCKFYRPLRTSHCKICNVCIEEIDHHCSWIGNCIGKLNRKDFIKFLVSTVLLAGFVFIYCILKLKKAHQQGGLQLVLDENAFELLAVCYSGIMLTGTFILLLVQFGLICRGLTSYECAKRAYRETGNPFNKGCWTNFKNLLAAVQQPSRIKIQHYLKQITSL